MPFLPAYLLWCALGLGFYCLALRQLSTNGKLIGAILLTPIVFAAIVTGQNGLFTATLLVLSVTLIKKHPMLAGLAAASLTIKPQLGLLIPIAYLAGRAWVPLLSATIGSLLLWGSSIILLGNDVWLAFLDSVLSVSGSIESGLMPLYKMVTALSALHLIGAPTPLAIIIFVALAGLGMYLVSFVWHRTEDSELRLAAICAPTLLIAPYGFYYELTIALPALLIVAKRGYQTGWLAYEAHLILLLFAASIALPGPVIRNGISLSFIFMLILCALTLRRIRMDLLVKAYHADACPLPNFDKQVSL